MYEQLGDKWGMSIVLSNIARIYGMKGDFDRTLEYIQRSIELANEIGSISFMASRLQFIGIIYHLKGDNDMAINYFEKTLVCVEKYGKMQTSELETIIYLYLSYKNINKVYDKEKLYHLINETANIDYELNYHLSKLLEDTSYLETAYSQVQEKADGMEDKFKLKFLSYPIPSAIVEEWEKVK